MANRNILSFKNSFSLLLLLNPSLSFGWGLFLSTNDRPQFFFDQEKHKYIDDSRYDEAPEVVLVIDKEAQDAWDEVADGHDKDRKKDGQILDLHLFGFWLTPDVANVANGEYITYEHHAMGNQHFLYHHV